MARERGKPPPGTPGCHNLGPARPLPQSRRSRQPKVVTPTKTEEGLPVGMPVAVLQRRSPPPPPTVIRAPALLSDQRGPMRREVKINKELGLRAMAFLYGTTLERWKAERLRAHARQRLWRAMILRQMARSSRNQELVRLERAARVISMHKLCLLAWRLREAHPTVLKLKRPLVPRDASPGAVVVLFLMPICIAIVAALASWTTLAVSLAGTGHRCKAPSPAPTPPTARIWL